MPITYACGVSCLAKWGVLVKSSRQASTPSPDARHALLITARASASRLSRNQDPLSRTRTPPADRPVPAELGVRVGEAGYGRTGEPDGVTGSPFTLAVCLRHSAMCLG